jgi:hypothetical protein
MNRLVFSLILFCSLLPIAARNLEFFGVELLGSNIVTMGEAVEKKGFTLSRQDENQYYYQGVFMNCNTCIVIATTDNYNVNAVYLTTFDIDIDTMARLTNSTIAKLTEKYPDYRIINTAEDQNNSTYFVKGKQWASVTTSIQGRSFVIAYMLNDDSNDIQQASIDDL